MVHREDAPWNAWLDEPGKDEAIHEAYQLAEAFRPSVVTVLHEDGTATKREFPADISADTQESLSSGQAHSGGQI